MRRSFLSSPTPDFLARNKDAILGELTRHLPFDLGQLQRNAWQDQIAQLKAQLSDPRFLDGHLFFEFSIPRMGKRADVVLIHAGIVFVIEYKVGESMYTRHALNQVMDYALDLKNFHEGSHERVLVPVLICTNASNESFTLKDLGDGLYEPLRSNGANLASLVDDVANQIREPVLDAEQWERSGYKPTPTIVQAAQALYRDHDVEEIAQFEASKINLTKTADAVGEIIDISKATGAKSICFITGVPGSGKTLAGLNIAVERQDAHQNEHAVFLSGNGPLVKVLREALIRDSVETEKAKGNKVTKSEVSIKVEEFIQNIHHFRDEAIKDVNPPVERVVIYDEAQRAWTREKAMNFMRGRDRNSDFSDSEPEFLIGTMDRHDGYAVIICLIGGGQEINTGEAGLPEWFEALHSRYPEWDVYVSSQLKEFEYNRGEDLYRLIAPNRLSVIDDLHLSVPIRSYRSERVSDFVKSVLDGDEDSAREALHSLQDKYPIVITRDLDRAREWLRQTARGTERYGIVASSGALRLKPLGLNLKAKIDPVIWFLNNDEDVRSSYYLEDVATEFDIQGLELDWVCVAWDGNFRRQKGEWVYQKFKGTKWQNIQSEEDRLFLKNAYRVLLTRARQGMVIFVPEGSPIDPTRPPAYYDETFDCLSDLGIQRA